MEGTFYNVDEWIHLVEKKRKNEMSEGALWWLSRIRAKQELLSS